MSNENRESSDQSAASPIVVGAMAPWRVSKEQLAAAERAQQYHVNKLAGCRQPLEADDAVAWNQPQPADVEPAVDMGGAV